MSILIGLVGYIWIYTVYHDPIDSRELHWLTEEKKLERKRSSCEMTPVGPLLRPNPGVDDSKVLGDTVRKRELGTPGLIN